MGHKEFEKYNLCKPLYICNLTKIICSLQVLIFNKIFNGFLYQSEFIVIQNKSKQEKWANLDSDAFKDTCFCNMNEDYY